MSPRALGLLLLGLASPLRGEVTVPVTASTTASDLFPQVTCTGTDAGLNADVLQLASDAREQLAPVLNLGGAWRFPVHIVVVMPDDPRAAEVHEERVSVDSLGNTMRIDATLPSIDSDARAFVQRQFVTALLWEKFFGQVKTFDAHTRLDVVPTWLIEGLNEWIDRENNRDREAIVRRAAQAQHAPTLLDVTSWQEISSDRLLGLYQRAFCYYLVNSLIQEGPKRDNFQQWLLTVAKTGPSSAKLLFPTEAGWQRQLLEAPERAHDVVFTWDESSSALNAAETIAVPGKKPDDTQVCTLDHATDLKPSPNLADVLRKKNFDLTELELRAHPGWRPIIALYRFGLSALGNGRPDEARKLIDEARQKRTDEIAYHQKLQDYMNWFEVTRDYAGSGSQFESYFLTAREMDRAQGDTSHPNPIRAGVLNVESQL